jgi:hypothetical protein
LNNTLFLSQKYSETRVPHCKNSKNLLSKNPLNGKENGSGEGREDGKRMREGRRGKGGWKRVREGIRHGRRERGDDTQKAGKVVGGGSAHRVGAIDASGRCHWKYIQLGGSTTVSAAMR